MLFFIIFIIVFILFIYYVERARIHCPYCNTKTVYCTGVDRVENPRTTIWICEKCGREIF